MSGTWPAAPITGVAGSISTIGNRRRAAAIAGAHPIAVMTKAGHASMATTKRYLKLAGVVFHEEAAAQEERLLGSGFYESSTDLTAPEHIVENTAAPSEPDSHLANLDA